VLFWIETKGKSLEEIDKVCSFFRKHLRTKSLITIRLFDGVKHSDVPDLAAIKNGDADIEGLIVDGVEAGKNQTTTAVVKKEDD
jgi:L-rhamnose isomerase